MKAHDDTMYGDESEPATSWGLGRRLRFIDFRLRWEGKINRTDLTDFFKISVPQASADLSKYMELAPFNMDYSVKVKAYLRSPNFRPYFARSASKTYLNELLAVKNAITEPNSSFIGVVPSVGAPPLPARVLDGNVLAVLLQAMRERKQVRVNYQSMTRVDAMERLISPHALGYDGMRWHVRTYCHSRERYIDMVIGRISSAKLEGISVKESHEDIPWHRIVTMVIGPHPGLTPGGKKAIQMEYAMADSGTLKLECRQALLFYALRRFRLESVEDLNKPKEHQIVLVNREALQPFVDELEF